MRTSFAVLALSAVASVSAQQKLYNNTDINVGAVPIADRASWCRAQTDSCTTLCTGTTANTCDFNTLSYNCTCNNGTAPGLQYYDQTLPYFICNQAYIDCIAANENNKNGQDECKESIVCLKNPPKKADAATTSTAAATPTGGSATTGAGSQATQTPASSSSTAFAAPTAIPALYGNAAAVAAMGLFAYMI